VNARATGGRLEQFDRAWTRLELGLAVAVTAGLVLSLVSWVVLKGLASKTTDTFVAGFVLRALVAAVVAGAVSRRFTQRAAVTTAVALAAGVSAWAWRDAGAEYFGNVLAWLQDGSLLTWVGGVRGFGTRLTLWLALLGASLATATGRHVTIDLVTRALGDTVRGPLQRLGGVVAAAVCLACAWGFFDFTAVDAFHAPASASATEKAGQVAAGLSRHVGLAWRQAGLDARMLPKVLSGQRWDRSLSAAEWNAALASSTDPAVQALLETDATATRPPLLSLPGEPARGLLVKDFNLVIPFGLAVLALRFLLWVLRGGPQEAVHGVDAPKEATA
jgi:hypothetical protein